MKRIRKHRLLRMLVILLFLTSLTPAQEKRVAPGVAPTVTEIIGKWKDDEGDEVKIGAKDLKENAVTFEGKYKDWEGTYHPQDGSLTLHRYANSSELSSKVHVQARKEMDKKLRWQMTLKAKRGFTDSCELSLQGSWYPGTVTWEIDSETKEYVDSTAKSGGMADDTRKVTYKKKRFGLPPLGSWLVPQWVAGEDRRILDVYADDARTEIAGLFTDKGAIRDMGRLYAIIFKAMFNALTGAAGAESFLGKFGEELLKNLGVEGLKGEVHLDAITKSFAKAVVGVLVDHAPDPIKKILEKVAEKGAEKITLTEEEKLYIKQYLECRIKFQEIGTGWLAGSKVKIHGMAIIDTVDATADFTLYIPEHSLSGNRSVKCPPLVLLGHLDDLPEAGKTEQFNQPRALQLQIVVGEN
ncbi:MAG: hypothetical protein DMF60_19010 [Acidobacteria bacterium]|nr:MAG: hypothetical protein DMF60_19010 [Acidobacteriota bacterium]